MRSSPAHRAPHVLRGFRGGRSLSLSLSLSLSRSLSPFLCHSPIGKPKSRWRRGAKSSQKARLRKEIPSPTYSNVQGCTMCEPLDALTLVSMLRTEKRQSHLSGHYTLPSYCTISGPCGSSKSTSVCLSAAPSTRPAAAAAAAAASEAARRLPQASGERTDQTPEHAIG